MACYSYCLRFSIISSLLTFVYSANFEFGHVDFSKKLSGYVFKTIHQVSLKTCWKECNARANCASFNYFRKTLTCELNTKRIRDLPEVISTKGIGYVYWERDSVVNTVDCSEETQCDRANTCDLKKNVCVPLECPVIVNVPVNGIATGNINDIGSMALLSFSVSGKALSWITECQADGQWSNQPWTSTGVWSLVFRGTPGIGVDVYGAWVYGNLTNTDDVTCKQLNVTSCTKNYRSPVVNLWKDLPILKVKYSLYHDNMEVAYVTFDGAGSDIISWFSQYRILESSWVDIKTETFNFFSIAGHGHRRFFINRNYGGCPVDRGYTVAVSSGIYPCVYDQQSSYPQFLYAKSTSHVLVDSETDFVPADLMAIHIMF